MAYKPGSVQWLPICKIIHLELLLPKASCNQPERHFRRKRPKPVVPIRFCTWWGLPCPLCHQKGGALLPHPFTLTFRAGGLLFVALPLKLPSLAINQHHSSVVPGLSSPAHAAAIFQPSDRYFYPFFD